VGALGNGEARVSEDEFFSRDDFVLGFQAGKFTCCVMGKDLRNAAAVE
jgi:hypothetical protein